MAELKTAVVALRESKLPTRVKRMRERLLRQEIDRIILEDKLEPVDVATCLRCQDKAHIQDSPYCYECIVHFLDILPRWVITGDATQEWADGMMAQLMKQLLDNKLIGIPEVDYDSPRHHVAGSS